MMSELSKRGYRRRMYDVMEQKQIVKKKRAKADFERKYCMKNKGVNVVIEEIKQRIKAKTTNIQKYDERNNQFVQKRLFPTKNSCLKKLREKVDKVM